MAMEKTEKTRTHFAFRIDAWSADGENIVEHVAGIEDHQLALVSFYAACDRWPGTPLTLRQGARVIEDSRSLRIAWFPTRNGVGGGKKNAPTAAYTRRCETDRLPAHRNPDHARHRSGSQLAALVKRALLRTTGR